MDPVLEKMQDILNYTKRQKEEGSWNQSKGLDLHQEMFKQNHILNHMGRAVKNPVGRQIGIAGGAMGGVLLTSFFVPHSARFCVKAYLTILGGGAVGSLLGWRFMARFFGNSREYKVFLGKKTIADGMMKEFDALYN